MMRALDANLPLHKGSIIIVIMMLATLVRPAVAQEELEKVDTLRPFDVVWLESNIVSEARLDSIPVSVARDSILVEESFGSSNILLYRFRGRWLEFPIGVTSQLIQFASQDLDSDGINELMVTGEIAQYGTGGGSTEYRTEIYKFDTAVWQIFRSVTGESEEMFGREYNNGANYLYVCSQNIRFDGRGIRIMPVTSEGSREHGLRHIPAHCTNFVQPGYFEFRNSTWTQIHAARPARTSKRPSLHRVAPASRR